MSESHHTIVWIDHSKATVSRSRGNTQSDIDFHDHAPLQPLHHRRTGWEAGGKLPEDTDFYQKIAGALANDSDVVITGPGNAKRAFKVFLDQHSPQMASRVEESDAGMDRPPISS